MSQPKPRQLTKEEEDTLFLLSTPVGFVTEVLKVNLYPWQAEILNQFEPALERQVMATACTPNGAGKDAVLISGLALWWVSVHKRGKVVITSADGRQIDEQTYPALQRHQGKFDSKWKFLDRYIETPTKGRIMLFVTDHPGRAEGFHKDFFQDGPNQGKPDPEGPLLIIVNEAKTVPEDIFTAIDRCTYNAILLASSPGSMHGRFYESHADAKRLGFYAKKVGLLDCPHIPEEKIARIIAQHGANSPKTRSMLHGEFMLADGETKFDQEGLDHLAAMSKEGHGRGKLGRIEESSKGERPIFIPDDKGWVWIDEMPSPGSRYMMFCDPNTCEQAEGTSERDNTACGVLRDACIDGDEEKKMCLAAALHWPGGVKWDSDVLADRMDLLSKFYGRCMAVVESNNFGSALLKVLNGLKIPLWRRRKVDDINPNKTHHIFGYLSNGRTREHWVQACAAMVRERSLVCRYAPATDEFSTFITSPSGKSEAITGKHDDWVAAIGIALVVQCWTTMPRMVGARRYEGGYAMHSAGGQSGGGQWGEGAFN